MNQHKTSTAIADPILRVENLTTEFVSRRGSVGAVRDVSFEVNRLDRLGIVGESGSGKSTLALSILGLIEPPAQVTAGRVLLKGRDLRTLSDRQLRGVRGNDLSLIFQDPMTALDPIRTIGDQLIEAIVLHQDVRRSVARRMAIDLLRDVELAQAAKRIDDYPHQYSGGMRQRVVIAMALANTPDVLIADEPTTALDVTTQAQVLGLMRRLADERSAAVVLITHNLGVVAEFCTSVQVMYSGRLVERSSVEDLFDHPSHPYTQALIASVPRPGAARGVRLPSIAGAPPPLNRLPVGCSFEPRCARGHDNEQCRTLRPIPRTVRAAAPDSMVECHFPTGADGSES